jgi:hypothetical protein
MNIRERWKALNPGGKKAAIAVAAILTIIAASAVTRCAQALEPGWYAPLDGSGQGIIVRCSDGGQCAANWLTYAPGAGQVWLISNEPCDRGEPCTTSLSRTEGSWMGIDGDAERLPAEVYVDLTPEPDGVRVSWDAIELLPACDPDTGSGGLLLEQCVGSELFRVLAR